MRLETRVEGWSIVVAGKTDESERGTGAQAGARLSSEENVVDFKCKANSCEGCNGRTKTISSACRQATDDAPQCGSSRTQLQGARR